MKAVARIAALVTALTVATPTLAQDRMTQDQCEQGFVAAAERSDGALTAEASVLDADGWCVVSGLEVASGPTTSFYVENLRWRASDVERFLVDGLPPRTFEIEGSRAGGVPLTGSPVFNYLLRIQMFEPEFAFRLTVRWDELQKTVSIDEAFVQFDATNRIAATATVEGVDLNDSAAIMASLGSAGLRDLSITSDFDGWFETYVLLVVGVAVLDDAEMSPQAQMADLKRQAVDWVSDRTGSFMSDASREALAAFIQSFPMPRGQAELRLDANPGIGAARIMPLIAGAQEQSPADVVPAILDGAQVLFTWQQTREPQ